MKLVLVALVAFLVAYFTLSSIRPLNPGALTVGDRVEIPYSWDLTGPKSALASVSPPEPRWLRVAAFSKYVGGAWVRAEEQLQGKFVGGSQYSVSVTPYAIMLYPAFPVPQPAPGTVPKVEGAVRRGDVFLVNGFSAKVIAKYAPPYPYASYPQLNYPVYSLVGEKKRWSTPRVQELAQRIYEEFKYKTLGELLDYLTNWLRKNYRYATKYSGAPGGDAVDWFLFVSKTGMCVHFASAAAVLLNDMGIKARVVYGFANSYVRGETRIFVTPTHLWVEVWTPGGWVPWDPSPPASVGAPEVQRAPTGISRPERLSPPRPASEARAGAPRFSVPPQALYVLPTALIAYLYGADLLKWLKSWPLAFRECVERIYGIKGLTLKEVSRLTGLRELEEAQLEYLKKGKWTRKGFMKAVKWCLSGWLRRTRSKPR